MSKATPDDPLTDALLDVLASTDLTWQPLRVEADRTAHYYAQRDYRQGGVRWTAGDTSTAEGQRAKRLLRRLEAEGLVEATRAGKGAGTRAKLTEKGFKLARQEAGVPGLAESIRALEAAERVYQKNVAAQPWRACHSGHQATEAELAAELGLSPECAQQLALPCLERDLLSSGSTVTGCVSYFVTKSGQELLARRLAAQQAQEPAPAGTKPE